MIFLCSYLKSHEEQETDSYLLLSNLQIHSRCEMQRGKTSHSLCSWLLQGLDRKRKKQSPISTKAAQQRPCRSLHFLVKGGSRCRSTSETCPIHLSSVARTLSRSSITQFQMKPSYHQFSELILEFQRLGSNLQILYIK